MVGIFSTVAVLVAVTAVTAFAVVGLGPTPPPRPLADAIHHALSGGPLPGVSADITFTNNLISSTSTTAGTDPGNLGGATPLLSGGSGRLWISADGQARIELQSSRGDTEIVLSRQSILLDDVATNTAYEVSLPAHAGTGPTGASGATGATGVPSVSAIQSALTRVMGTANLSAATPTDIGGAPAYTVTLSPKHPAGLLGSAQIGWDAEHGIPLDLAVYATGERTPVLELRATHVSFGAIDPSVFAISPPAGGHIVHIAPSANGSSGGTTGTHPALASGLAAASAAVPFTLDAPATLGGLQRGQVAAISWNGHAAALIQYGSGLGAVGVIERAATGQQGGLSTGPLGSLPQVALGGGVSGTELDTALGTVVTFRRGGVDYLVGGLVAPATVDAVARGL